MLKNIFLDRILKRHPDNFNKYDYSLLPDEFKVIDKIKIICKDHGIFEQLAYNHSFKKGCSKCRGGVQSNINEFITKSNLVHNDKYSYNKTIYFNNHIKIVITCPIHGDFKQRPNDHLSGKGCKKCGLIERSNLRKSNTEEFIHKAKLIHGGKYDYSPVEYIGNKYKVKIKCIKHGDFLQTPDTHLSGGGCLRCKESHGEKHIAQILDKYNIKYIREYKLLENKYRYDFYLPEYNIYIEYHGRQHYNSIKWFGGNDAFKDTRRRDKTKIELIKRSTGLLVVIKYVFNTLEKIEDELLRLFSYIHPQFFTDMNITKQVIIDSNIYLIDNGVVYIRSNS